ncbi:nudix hydrolase 20, chloroplastic-like isoform X1 [Pelobates cultripes]|uniref:Nudix hydrolase 20, chloroplastic-like isoform X1 n=2 Tax=Pelobates cultripes TaxID=61616 RepID=A0AAD1T2K6_PELCU|nr:nudix hydrolase 20, chloroplastic-like isoform X1 [Pelobates cultripes]
MAATGWSERMLQLVLKMNGFHSEGCLPFVVCGQRVGWVVESVAQHLAQFPAVFTCRGGTSARLELNEGLQTPQERTLAVQNLMRSLRTQKRFPCLQEWRDELYDVRSQYSDLPFLSMERAATPLLGVPRYGVHVNGYLRKGAEMFMWIGRRSKIKPSYPGMLDHLAAGGIAAGSGVWETLLKECTEEACIPEPLAASARPVGTVSYAYRQQEAVFLECQFVFDLEVPETFKPSVGDGEVQDFYLWPLDKVKDAIASEVFKPNCALVILDFLIRNGFVEPDKEKFYQTFVENLHGHL